VSALAGAAALSGIACQSAQSVHHAEIPAGDGLKMNDVILFQGDSITDAGRNRKEEKNANRPDMLGQGYAFLAAGYLLDQCAPLKPAIYNRGISGNKVCQLAERWDKDCLELKPTVLSILIGVNDYWHIRQGKYQGTAETYRRDYIALLERTRAALPHCRLIIGEPFILKCGAVDESWFAEFSQYQKYADEIARQFKADFIPYQEIFNQALKKAPADYWAGDGVHPTLAGSHRMTQAWIQTLTNKNS